MQDKYSYASTKEEFKYIDTIGKWHESTKDIPRKVMLQKYYHALLQRQDWGSLDPNEILTAVQNEIRIA